MSEITKIKCDNCGEILGDTEVFYKGTLERICISTMGRANYLDPRYDYCRECISKILKEKLGWSDE